MALPCLASVALSALELDFSCPMVVSVLARVSLYLCIDRTDVPRAASSFAMEAAISEAPALSFLYSPMSALAETPSMALSRDLSRASSSARATLA